MYSVPVSVMRLFDALTGALSVTFTRDTVPTKPVTRSSLWMQSVPLPTLSPSSRTSAVSPGSAVSSESVTVAVPPEAALTCPDCSVPSGSTTVTAAPSGSAAVSISTAISPSSERSISAPCSVMVSATLLPASAYIALTRPSRGARMAESTVSYRLDCIALSSVLMRSFTSSIAARTEALSTVARSCPAST